MYLRFFFTLGVAGDELDALAVADVDFVDGRFFVVFVLFAGVELVEFVCIVDGNVVVEVSACE